MHVHDKKVKIVATLGPASSKPEIISGLLQAGVNVFRLNFSHGTHDDHLRSINIVREQSNALDCSAAILADLQGPKIRTGKTLDNRSVTLRKGSSVAIVSTLAECNEKLISIDYPNLAQEINTGQLIMINDGAVRLQVETIGSDNTIHCRVLSGGIYSSHKGVNLPDVDLKIPSLTPKDCNDLEFILHNDIQLIALSFVRKAIDIVALRELIDAQNSSVKVIAKIEKPEAAHSIEEILHVSDGIMVARGDLGVETSPYDVPILQKKLINEANASGKIVIVATQMLESMIIHSLPTRAESSDVANAVIDGTDAVMLSGETAVGDYPVESVAMMNHIILSAEQSSFVSRESSKFNIADKDPSHAVCSAAAHVCKNTGGRPVCVFTLSGSTALYLSKIRNQSLIYAFSPDKEVVKMLSIAWNVIPFYLPFTKDVAGLQRQATELLLARNMVDTNEHIVFVSGTTSVKGATNSIHVVKVGE